MRSKNIILTIVLFLACFFSNAQQKKLEGIWELKKTTNNDGEIIDIPLGMYKILDANGNFSNMQLRPGGAILSHKGTYEIKETGDYIEHVAHQIGHRIDKKQSNLKYTLSEDETLLTLTGELLLNGSEGKYRYKLHEIWKKVNLPN